MGLAISLRRIAYESWNLETKRPQESHHWKKFRNVRKSWIRESVQANGLHIDKIVYNDIN